MNNKEITNTIKMPKPNETQCELLLKVSAELNNIELETFLNRDKVKEVINDIKMQLNLLANSDEIDNVKFEKAKDCILLTVKTAKEILTEKVKSAVNAYGNKVNLEENKKEVSRLDKDLNI